ncbi:MAG: RagB/SusD family nutrient uptake outer membrane protein [Prevotella sp.]|nr:RagB/SusD family nutrient uptake outer membrane protein [Prevotella sp.]
MKSKIIISFASVLLAGVSLTSCSDFLDGSKQNRSNIDDSQITPEQRRNQAFYELRSIYEGSDMLGMLVKGTDIYINQSGDGTGEKFYAYTLTPSNEDAVKTFYATCYDAINNANAAIDNSGSQVDADARFTRALCYYNLLQQFGGVPLITKPITTSERNYPRTPAQEVYDFILSDMKSLYASASIPATNHEGHASLANVAALTAKIALAAGWDVDVTVTDAAQGTYSFSGDTHQYFATAKEYATNAVTQAGGESALVDSYEKKWLQTNEGNSEELFSIQYDRAISADAGTELSAGHMMEKNFCGYYGSADNGQKLMIHGDNPTKKMLALYTEGDERWEATFMTTLYLYSASDAKSGYYGYYNYTDDEKKSAGIKYRFLPPYYTNAEVIADFNEHMSQYQAGKALVVRMGDGSGSTDKVGYYLCGASQTSLTESQIQAMDYYTDAVTSAYTGYLKNCNGTYTGLVCKKWDDINIDKSANRKQNYRDVVILSLSDIILVRAEAKMMLGEDYLSDVNLIRTRAKADNIQSLASYDPAYTHSFTLRDIDIILDERALELFGEMTRWEDLRRTKQLVLYYNAFNNNSAACSIIGSDGNPKWYRPIPANEISSNTGISEKDQNPGY